MTRPALFAFVPFAAACAVLASACSAPAETPATPDPSPAATPLPAGPAVDPAVDAWMRDYVKDGALPLRYAAATTGGPDPLILIYLVGGEYCGSGGCTLLVLHRDGDAVVRLGRLTVTQTPVRVLDSASHGRPDLAVGVRGGGADPHEARIPFDGRRYAPNPTVAPARPIEGAASGRILITDDTPKITVRAE